MAKIKRTKKDFTKSMGSVFGQKLIKDFKKGVDMRTFFNKVKKAFTLPIDGAGNGFSTARWGARRKRRYAQWSLGKFINKKPNKTTYINMDVEGHIRKEGELSMSNYARSQHDRKLFGSKRQERIDRRIKKGRELGRVA